MKTAESQNSCHIIYDLVRIHMEQTDILCFCNKRKFKTGGETFAYG